MNPHPSAPAYAEDRAAVNRRNAARSTGPRTEEGKRRSSLNALRHGLTGQTVVLPEDDLAAYQRHCAQFHAELKPQGLLETKAVQTIADTYGRLDRIRAMENNLFSLGFMNSQPSYPRTIPPSTAPSSKPNPSTAAAICSPASVSTSSASTAPSCWPKRI